MKQQLAAVRMLFDWLITGQIVPVNPAAAVRGPKHVVKTGKTAVLDAKEWRKLLYFHSDQHAAGPAQPGAKSNLNAHRVYSASTILLAADCRPNHRTGPHPQ